MKKIGLFIAICLIGAYFTFGDRAIERSPGILAPKPPLQKALHSSTTPVFEKNGYRIIALASFEAEARVLLKKNYYFGDEADISPVDLALGWGRMSDSQILERIELSQSNRFYFWRTERFPIPRREIETHSANMHMVPATDTIHKKLKTIQPGNLVRFSGYLIEARRQDGWHWRSSLTRNDTGNGACELIWVENLEVY